MAVACIVVKVLHSASARGGVEREVQRAARTDVCRRGYVLIDDVKLTVGIIPLNAVRVGFAEYGLMLKPRELSAERHLVGDSTGLRIRREVDVHRVRHLVDRKRLLVSRPVNRHGGCRRMI
ncbi:hypothetical protein EVA_04302 [gut metagenome]|uniref:Uncharacterized protein n=1 Tax=gut metagenome TaxID=749906 RepID=J9D4L1_9ZZZZ